MNPRKRLAASFLAGLLRLWGRTWRVSAEGPDPFAAEPGRAQIGATWHEDFLMLAWAFRDRDFSVPVSRSSDGDWIAAALSALGYSDAARGSSSRGGAAALRGLVRRVREGTTVSLQIDGPRGPARVAKPGVVHLARMTARPITPLVFRAHPCLRFSSWDRTRLPLPFARVVICYGPPIEIAATLGDDEVAKQCTALGEALLRLER